MKVKLILVLLLCVLTGMIFNGMLYAQRIMAKSKSFSLNIDASILANNIQKWAVVIGISKYKNSSKGITELRYADDDAKAFYEFLNSPNGGGFPKSNVRLLVDEDATKDNIVEAINDFLNKAVGEDIVVIFFAGHGSPDPKNDKNLFLLPYDADLNRLGSTGYLMDHLREAMNRFIKAKHIIVFADACHSAGISGGIGGRGNSDEAGLLNRYFLNLVSREESKVIFTAAEASERSFEDEKWDGHGVFTWALLKGLKGEADGFSDGIKDGIVTIGELIDYTQDKVRRETNGEQHPIQSTTSYDRRLPMSILNK